MSAGAAGRTAPSRPPRLQQLRWAHPEWGVVLVTTAAWAAVVLREPVPAGPHAGMLHVGMQHVGSAGSPPAVGPALLASVTMSAVMSAAMMLPSVLPTARAVALTSRWHRRQRALAVFTGSYLLAWILLSAAATTVVALLASDSRGPWSGAAALVGAAAWELSPGKARYLRACHRLWPSGNDGWSADLACARAGLRQARSCLGACWALMVAMVLVSTATLLVMVVLSVVISAEKLLAAGPRLGPWAAVLLVGTAAVLASA